VTDLALPLPDSLAYAHGHARAAVVLGSGFGGLAEVVERAEVFPYDEIEGCPVPSSAVPGHAGRLLLGDIAGAPVIVFSGRLHMYQGLSALEAAWTSRLAHALGARTVVLTNAAGAVSPDLAAGDVVLIEDQLNLTDRNPLVGWPGPADGVPFVSMSEAYDEGLCRLALATAADVDLQLRQGVYAGVLGPSFETLAEVRMLRALGADVVGMSTVVEAIAARALGLRVLGVSLVANAAGGKDLAHDEVLLAGLRSQACLTRFLLSLLPRL
jgi:purine-nucleoside phosphorylase